MEHKSPTASSPRVFVLLVDSLYRARKQTPACKFFLCGFHPHSEPILYCRNSPFSQSQAHGSTDEPNPHSKEYENPTLLLRLSPLGALKVACTSDGTIPIQKQLRRFINSFPSQTNYTSYGDRHSEEAWSYPSQKTNGKTNQARFTQSFSFPKKYIHIYSKSFHSEYIPSNIYLITFDENNTKLHYNSMFIFFEKKYIWSRIDPSILLLHLALPSNSESMSYGEHPSKDIVSLLTSLPRRPRKKLQEVSLQK